MTDQEVLAIIKRKSSIPMPDETYAYINKAYDRAAEIIQASIDAAKAAERSATSLE